MTADRMLTDPKITRSALEELILSNDRELPCVEHVNLTIELPVTTPDSTFGTSIDFDSPPPGTKISDSGFAVYSILQRNLIIVGCGIKISGDERITTPIVTTYEFYVSYMRRHYVIKETLDLAGGFVKMYPATALDQGIMPLSLGMRSIQDRRALLNAASDPTLHGSIDIRIELLGFEATREVMQALRQPEFEELINFIYDRR